MENNSNNKWIWVVVVVIVLVLGAYLLWKPVPEEGTTPTLGDDTIPTSTQGETPLVTEGPNAVNVSSQVAGSAVKIDMVMLAKAGYVVIHVDNGGQAGDIIGSSNLLEVGQSNDVSVTLTKAAEEGKSYWAMLHEDNGDGKFSAVDDQPVKDSQGNVIMMKFDAGQQAMMESENKEQEDGDTPTSDTMEKEQ